MIRSTLALKHSSLRRKLSQTNVEDLLKLHRKQPSIVEYGMVPNIERKLLQLQLFEINLKDNRDELLFCIKSYGKRIYKNSNCT